jgi:hypothetical protein
MCGATVWDPHDDTPIVYVGVPLVQPEPATQPTSDNGISTTAPMIEIINDWCYTIAMIRS